MKHMTDGYDLSAERKAVARATERWLRFVLPTQLADGSDQDGGFEEGRTGWCDGREAAFIFARLGGALTWIISGDIDADAVQVRQSMQRAIRFVVNRQRSDGQLDLGAGYSPNEAGFVIPGIVEAYLQLKIVDHKFAGLLREDVEKFVHLAAEAVVSGSAYTANHRWTAAAAPLAAAHKLFPDARYLQKIESYLADGIDCDEAGLWHEERSPNYNMVANAGMIYLADSLNRPQLLDHVVRNLNFTLHALQPNGEIDTSFSHRQDRAAPGQIGAQLGQARRVAQLSGDGRFTTLARSLWPGESQPMPHELMPVQFEIDRHPLPLPGALPLPTTYEMLDQSALIARVRKDRTALTLAADAGGHFFSDVRDRWGGTRLSDDWFRLQHDELVIQSIHLSPAGMYAMQPSELRQAAPGKYHLAGRNNGWTHTLHFRPGSPTLQMPAGLESEILVQWDSARSMRLKIAADTAQSLVANLTFWIRTSAEVSESNRQMPMAAGKVTMLDGGGPLVLSSGRTKARIVIGGLPKAAHRYPVQPAQPIPSAMKEHCAGFSLGLRFPVHLELTVDFE
jgi:hypothetical protein